jgi:hypothetical protein
MQEYQFDPKFILKSLIEIYLSFKDYKEFLEFIVKDERSYKIENFEKVIRLKENDKIRIDYNMYQDLIKMVDKLKDVSKETKSSQVLNIILK